MSDNVRVGQDTCLHTGDDEVLARKVSDRLTIPNKRVVEWITLEKVNDRFWTAEVLFWHQERGGQAVCGPDEEMYQVFLDEATGEITRVRKCPQVHT